MNKIFIEKYIQELETVKTVYYFTGGKNYEDIYRVIRKCIKVIGEELKISEKKFAWKSELAGEDADILIDILKYNLTFITNNINEVNNIEIVNPVIFISHKSEDKKYGDALRNFICDLGVKNEQLIYTSHELHKIPLDADIFDYLRSNIHSNMFMIILWSNEYLDSPACLNEMGAAWIVQSDFTNIFTPGFSMQNPKYHECALKTGKFGIYLNGDGKCKISMLELKNKIEAMFNLKNDEKKVSFLLDKFVEEIGDNFQKESNVIEF